jgi:hypothetical protein
MMKRSLGQKNFFLLFSVILEGTVCNKLSGTFVENVKKVENNCHHCNYSESIVQQVQQNSTVSGQRDSQLVSQV